MRKQDAVNGNAREMTKRLSKARSLSSLGFKVNLSAEMDEGEAILKDTHVSKALQ